MSLSRSLITGTSALQSQQKNFDVISNNIANANTTGYKSNKATFADQFNQIYNYGNAPDSNGGVGLGGTNPLQIGLGVKFAGVRSDMTQGPIETTNRPLDMAIQGDGYFIYNNNGSQEYSRAGAINRDKSGNLIDSATGAFLQGYNVATDVATGKTTKDTDGNNILNRTLSNLVISPNVKSTPKQSENVSVTGNLNSQSALNDKRSTSITIYDGQGASRTLGLTFEKTAVDATTGISTYSLTGTIDGKTVAITPATMTFNADGSINTPARTSATDPTIKVAIASADLNTAAGTTAFTKDLNVVVGNADSIMEGITQFATASSATALQQDGHPLGELKALAVDSEGKIWGSFTNGESEILGQTAIAKFANPEALVKNGSNMFTISPNSGLANIGTAGEIFNSTTIAGGSLEQSNVDLTQQFTDMITAQRSFEAAARTITLSDQLLAETTALKR